MDNLHGAARVLFIAVAAAAGGLSLFFWIRALRQIADSDLDPEERRKWRRHVFLTRGLALIQWEQYRRKRETSSRPRRPEDEGLNEAPPPGAD